MTDEHKLSSIRVVFTNGTTEVFKNVESVDSDERTLNLFIAHHMYATQVFLDKVVYLEEVIDDNSVTYFADGATYTMCKGREKMHD